jgi:hypothetical protein
MGRAARIIRAVIEAIEQLPELDDEKKSLTRLRVTVRMTGNGQVDCVLVSPEYRVALPPTLDTPALVRYYLTDEARRTDAAEIPPLSYAPTSKAAPAGGADCPADPG